MKEAIETIEREMQQHFDAYNKLKSALEVLRGATSMPTEAPKPKAQQGRKGEAERLRKLKDAAERGLNQTEASIELGISQATVSSYARKWNITFSKKRTMLDPNEANERLDAIKNLAAQGFCLSEVSRRLKASPGSVSYAAHMHNIRFAPYEGHRQYENRMTIGG